jgi:hypothetical protein
MPTQGVNNIVTYGPGETVILKHQEYDLLQKSYI